MCTAVSYRTDAHYFGRNLDLEYHYDEKVVITPRAYPFNFRYEGECRDHFAMIGMATVVSGCPLYYDATNEKGLSIAALNFPNNAVYSKPKSGAVNIPSFEVIPLILSRCADANEAYKLLENAVITDDSFSEGMPCSLLHWMVADKKRAFVIEPTKDGLKVTDNPAKVLTNDPPFDFQMLNLNSYMNLTSEVPENRFSPRVPLTPYCKGMGAFGMPGDLSSASRFVKAAFTALNSVSDSGEDASVNQFFKILRSVEQPRGCVHLGEGKYEITIYSSCCNTDTGVYYYTTYENSRISAVDMRREDLDGSKIKAYPLITKQSIEFQN